MPYASLPVVGSVRQVLATATSSDEAVTRVLEAVGDSMGWLVGAFWARDPADGALVARCVWSARIHKGTVFAAETREMRLAPGRGLPGGVWVSGETRWVEDVNVHPDFVRPGAAAEDGLHAAVVFPVRHGGEMLGVLEFFTDLLRAPVDTLLPVFDQIGAEVGEFIVAMRDAGAASDAETAGDADAAGDAPAKPE